MLFISNRKYNTNTSVKEMYKQLASLKIKRTERSNQSQNNNKHDIKRSILELNDKTILNSKSKYSVRSKIK